MEKLVIAGVGGFAIEVAALVESMASQSGLHPRYQVVGFLAHQVNQPPQSLVGMPVFANVQAAEQFVGAAVNFFCALGDNALRDSTVKDLLAANWNPASIVHPSAVILAKTRLGRGIYVAPFCFISTEVELGDYAIINTHSVVGHHTVISPYAQLCPGAVVTAHCTVGSHALIGSNATLIPNSQMGPRSTLAAASLSPRVLPEGEIYMGVPARALPKSKK